MNPDSSHRPAFLITIDTEGDNLWARPTTITTHNAQYLPRFQTLCESYGLRPTYLTNWEMANCPVFQEFARHVLRRRAAEIGMHLHAWHSPPDFQLTDNDIHHQPYLIEYPPAIMRQKIALLTHRLRSLFDAEILSHRAGRWAFNQSYAQALLDHGYKVDCSVTPHYSWQDCLGAPDGEGGADYRAFPDQPYFVDPGDISRPGDSALLELPVSIVHNRNGPGWRLARRAARTRFASRVVNRLHPQVLWPYPGVQSFRRLTQLARMIVEQRRPYFMLVLHSSELMPGGSPRFAASRSVERLYTALEELFAFASARFDALTLAEFHCQWSKSAQGGSPDHALVQQTSDAAA